MTDRYYIKHMKVQDFRIIKGIDFTPGRCITLFVGKNGTAKSTLLGMIAQGFSFNPLRVYGIAKKEYDELAKKSQRTPNEDERYNKYVSLRTYLDTNYESAVNEHFNLSETDARGLEHAEILMQYTRQNKMPIQFKIESNNYADRVNPRLVTRRIVSETTNIETTIDTSSSNIIFPLVYMGLTRVLPIVESGRLSARDLGITDADLLEIHTLYESILLKQYSRQQSVGISNKRKKNTLAFLPSDRSLETISSGEDCVGQILLALFSFKKLKATYPNYEGGILLIDEIDATLYPAAQNRLMDVIEQKSKDYGIQVFATTHSLSLIEHTMSYRFKRSYRQGAIAVLSLKNADSETLSIESVDSLIKLKNEFFASNNEKEQSEKINVYFEDKEAQEVFSRILPPFVRNKLKMQSHFTASCGELIKFRTYGIREFTHRSLICLDGDQTIPNGYHNYFTLPSIDAKPPEAFIYSIIEDPNSEYWRHVKNYSHSVFMNNSHYRAVRAIVGGFYGNESQDCHEGLYHTDGEYRGLKPREVWKNWYKEEKANWKQRNNPVSFWMKQDTSRTLLDEFCHRFVVAYNFCAQELGINEKLLYDEGSWSIENP